MAKPHRKPVAPIPGKPARQCVACRLRAPASQLLRLAVGPHAEVVMDVSRRLPGRGVHVCPKPACIRAAVERGALGRGFKEPVVADPAALCEAAALGLQRKALSLLGLCRRTGKLRTGTDDVERSLMAQQIACVVVASDASERTAREIALKAGHVGTPVLSGWVTKENMGALVGRDDTAIMGFPHGPMAQEFAFLHQAVTQLNQGVGSARHSAVSPVPGVETPQRGA